MKHSSLHITTFEELMASKTPMTPQYLIEIIQAKYISHKLARRLAKQLSNMSIFEACARGELTSEQGTELLMLQRESDYWIVRLWKNLIG